MNCPHCGGALPVRNGLTKRQADLLAFIRDYLAEHGHSPSFEEMQIALELAGKSSIAKLVSALENRGHITRRRYEARSIELMENLVA